MDWTRAIDAYCERTDPGYWAEPVNALTNLAFIISAALMYHRCAGLIWGRALSAVLFAIGIGSFLFHTHATPWAGVLDVLPILAFSMLYVFLANRDFWGLSGKASVWGAFAFLPYTALLTPVFAAFPPMDISSVYWPLPLLIFAYAVGLRRRASETARNLTIGALILCASLTARSLDETVCPGLPLGTHFLWHILNAIMLGWMIETWARHVRQS